MLKTCTYCKLEKPITEFYPRKDRPGKFIANCKKCSKINNRRYRDKEYRKKWAASYYQRNKHKIGLKKYGLSVEDYDTKLKSQDQACAICKRQDNSRLFVDHCHKTGQIRGLLCSSCNFLLGHANESKQILLNSVEYLSKYEKE